MKKRPNPKPSGLLGVLETLALGLTIVSGSIAVPILCTPFYYVHIYALKLPQATGLTAGEIRQAYNQMLLYCLGRGSFSTGVLPWSESGKSHFTDVRRLFLLDLRLLAGAILALLILWLLSRMLNRRPARLLGRGPSFWAGIVLGVGFGALGVLASRNFTKAFRLFHQLFFPGKSNWVFDPEVDGIINVLPEVYFRNCGILILVVLAAGCLWGIIHDIRH